MTATAPISPLAYRPWSASGIAIHCGMPPLEGMQLKTPPAPAGINFDTLNIA